jgi:cytochrome c oxidase subunit 2
MLYFISIIFWNHEIVTPNPKGQNMKHAVVIAILVILCTFLVHTGLTNIGLLPLQASAQSVTIDQLFDIQLWLISFLLSLIMVTLVYSLIVFRRKKGETGDGAYIVGSSGLEVAWTAIPLLVVIILGFIGARSLGEVRRIDPSAMKVKVIAGQWFWQFQYPEFGVASTELHLPVDRQVDLQMTSQDVIHSFWVPEFRVKQDLVPGRTTDLRITPTVIGKYKVLCAELCGLNHAYMEGGVFVESQQDFESWIKNQQNSAPTDPVLRGELLAQQYGCANCHSVDGSEKTGPTWYKLFESEVELDNGTSVVADHDYLLQSIINPPSQVVKGYPGNVMPSFADTLDQTQVEALAAYIESLK